MTSTDLLGLEGKVALIWGGGQGMGEASATMLGKAGCKLAVVDFHAGRTEAAVARLTGQGFSAVGIVADITSEEDVTRATAEAESALGPLDIMVSIVGASIFKPLMDVTVEEWQRDQDLNLKSAFLSSRAAARSMRARGAGGAIVLVNSVSGLTSAPYHAPYGAAKAGLQNLVRSMAVEWGGQIRVNAIAPGSIITQRLPKLDSEDHPDSPYQKRIPMKRRGTIEEIGKGVLFMASDLGSYVTGQTLAVDGGWMSAWLFDAPSEGGKPEKLAD